MTGLSAINLGSFSSAMGGAFAKTPTGAKFAMNSFAKAFSAKNSKDEYVPSEPVASRHIDSGYTGFGYTGSGHTGSITFKRPTATPVVDTSPKAKGSLSEQELFTISEQELKFSAATSGSEEVTSLKLSKSLDSNPLPLDKIISDTLTKALEASGITLKAVKDRVFKDGIYEDIYEWDRITLTLNGKGEFSVNANYTLIDGVTGDALDELCNMLSAALKEELGDGVALGSAKFQEFAKKRGLHFEHIDLEKIKDDPNFSLGFLFAHDFATQEPTWGRTLGYLTFSPHPVPSFEFSRPFHYESWLADGGALGWDDEGNAVIAPGYQQFNKENLAANFDGERWNDYNRPARTAAVWQWIKDNDLSVESIQTMSRREYYDMVLKAKSEGIAIGGSFLTRPFCDEPVIGIEGTDWEIFDEVEILVGHEILDVLAQSGLVDSKINKYGFAIEMPGLYNGVCFMMTNRMMPDGTTKMVPIDNSELRNYETIHRASTTPEICFRDALGLDGMDFDDRKLFLDMVQKILDEETEFEIDVRHLKFSIGLTLDVPGLSNEARNTIEAALNQNSQLVDMKLRADASGNKGLGEFTISILDAEGNALARDQVRLIAGGKSVTTSVDSIKDMNQQQIYEFINGR